jgi:hypothetical protein
MPPIPMQRSFEMHVRVDIDVKFHVDLGMIAAVFAAQWIYDRVRARKIDLHPRLNQKELPTNEADAVKMIKDDIESPDTKKDSR